METGTVYVASFGTRVFLFSALCTFLLDKRFIADMGQLMTQMGDLEGREP
jgi:hypothetical protein